MSTLEKTEKSLGLRWPLDYFAEQVSNTPKPTWRKVNVEKDCSLRLNESNLIIEDKGVSIYSVDFSVGAKNLRVKYANGNIGIKAIDKNGSVSTIRAHFANDGNKSSSDVCSEVVNELKKFIPVSPHPSHTYSPILIKSVSSITKSLVSESSSQVNHDGYQPIFRDSEMEKHFSDFVLHPEFPNKVVEIWQQLGLK